MSYGYDNELKSINSKAVQVDKDGNLLTYTLNGVKYAADYDSQNNLLSFDGINYEYDSEGNRIKVSEGSKETTFVVDTDNPNSKYSQLLTEETDGKVKYHIYGNGLIGTYESESEEGSESFLTNHYDLRGSTVSISDTEGNKVGTVDYDEYGVILHQDESIETSFLYNGQYGVQTDDNGLNYMRNRYYNPKIKRFMNRDVVVGNIEDSQTLNRYAYVNGNPITYNDPFGLARESIVGSSWLSTLQTTLDIAGMVPGLGVFPDVLNAGIYLASGNYEEALWSGLGAVPIVGDATSGVRNVNKLSKVINSGGKIPKKWDSDKPGGYEVFDIGKHGKLSPGKNRAKGNKNIKEDTRIQSHHMIQDEWAKRWGKKNGVRYKSKEAPTILLPTGKGEIHTSISTMQKNRRVKEGFGTDVRYEFNESYRELMKSGVETRIAKKAMRESYKYYDGLDAFK